MFFVINDSVVKMIVIRLLPVFLSAIFLGAHYSRADNSGLAALCLVLPFLLLIRRRWVVWITQVLLLMGSLVWFDTILGYVKMRQVSGETWLRLAIILGAVALFTAASALVFYTKSLRRHYPHTGKSEGPGAAAFLITAILLGIVQAKVRPPVLLLERFYPGGGWILILLLSLYARFISEKMLNPLQSALWRYRIWILFSVVFFSQLIIGLAGYEKFLMAGQLHLPIPALVVAGPLYRAERFFMPILFVVTVVLIGSAWCSHLCYLGAGDAFSSARIKRPKALPQWSQQVRIGILALVIAVAMILRAFGAPVSIATGLAILFGLVGIGIIVFWSRKNGVMAHCVMYCPLGILANWLGKISPFRIRITKECNECQACSLVCRYDALNIEDIQKRRPGSSCTLCGDCIGSCKEKWIEYRFLKLKPAQARVLFIILAVSLHAVFLGIAKI